MTTIPRHLRVTLPPEKRRSKQLDRSVVNERGPSALVLEEQEPTDAKL